MKNSILILSLLFILFACKDTKERFTPSGFRYVVHTEMNGTKPKIGDYVTLEIRCETDDTVLIDTRKIGSPYRFRLDKVPFAGSYEDGLQYIGVGDSATFYVPADSLFNHLFPDAAEKKIAQSGTKLKKGTYVRYEVKMVKVQDYVSAEQEMQMRFSQLEKEEKKMLADFITKNKITEQPDEDGLIMLFTKHGNGAPADSGKMITVFFRGRLMDGSVFNASSKDRPYQFTMGTGEVIDGWEKAFSRARNGDMFTLLMPSKLGYGEEGLLDTRSGKYIVPPYSPLIFDVVVAGVDDPSIAVK
jgi:FKBP-type peptidyl-prolyl cis-trans isomerase FkpA